MIDDLLLHVILPRVLPNTWPSSFYRAEESLLSHMVKNIVNSRECMPPKTIEMFQRLERMHLSFTPTNISNEINELKSGDTFAIYVRRQNCMFIVYVPSSEGVSDSKIQNVIVATFPGNLHSSEIYKHDSDIEVISVLVFYVIFS